MKDQIQEKAEEEILEIKRIFVASFHNVDVLFIKPKTKDALTLKLPKNFSQNLKLKIGAKI